MILLCFFFFSSTASIRGFFFGGGVPFLNDFLDKSSWLRRKFGDISFMMNVMFLVRLSEPGEEMLGDLNLKFIYLEFICKDSRNQS